MIIRNVLKSSMIILFYINVATCWNPTNYPFLPASTDRTNVRQFVIDAQGANKKILDIGCGTGQSTSSTQGSLGIDSDRRLIRRAEKLFPHKRFKLGVVGSWNRATKYDIVTCMFYFHKIPRYLRKAIIVNAIHIATERVVIVDVSPEYKDYIAMSHANPFMPDYIKTCRCDLDHYNFTETVLADGLLNIWILEQENNP